MVHTVPDIPLKALTAFVRTRARQARRFEAAAREQDETLLRATTLATSTMSPRLTCTEDADMV
jgi:hypothetical protein